MAFQYFLYLPTLPDHAGNQGNQTANTIAYDTVDVILPFWQIAGIKTFSRFNAAQELMKLHYHQGICQEEREGIK